MFIGHARQLLPKPCSTFCVLFIDLRIMAEDLKSFLVEYAPQGRAKCKGCKEQIEKSSARIAKLAPNPFSEDGGLMKQWYHVKCIFDSFSRARATTKKIEDAEDLDGFVDMKQDDQNTIKQLISGLSGKKVSPGKKASQKPTSSPGQKKVQGTLTFSPTNTSVRPLMTVAGSSKADNLSASKAGAESSKDDAFREFRKLCVQLAEEPSYNAKTRLVANLLKKGPSGSGFQGDTTLWVKMLLPAINKRVYNLQSKQLVKLFSQIFCCNYDDMVTHLEEGGDVSETISNFFTNSIICKPAKKSNLTLQQVDSFLDRLKLLTKEDDQQRELCSITQRCTSNDLKYIIRLIKHDLRMNAGAKHVLEAIDPDAYKAFQASNDLEDVVKRCLEKHASSGNDRVPGMSKKLSIRASLMTPVKPMLAEACKTFSYAIKKCPKGMLAEIKYDGERVQVHKSGSKFEFFSRSLKPVLPHKVSAFRDFLPKACPHGNNLILDCEVLLVDNKTSLPLPFGTLGIHKKSAFKDANVCLFIFDCLQFNEENVMRKSMTERRKILEENVTVIPNRIMLSETTFVKDEKKLSQLMARAMRDGLEGLVLKDVTGQYEPGKRHWLKMKKDYLEEGSMADTADLVVLGAYYGTGNKGGLMSVFLMGVFNPRIKKWCTVAKCGNGHDDKTLDKLNRELKVKKISKDPNRVPVWLEVHRSLIPDFVVDDPKKAPVWEITGAEFSKSTTHTADGISIRFPRVTRIRDDKDWETATDLDLLKTLFKNSRGFTDVSTLMKYNTKNEDEPMDSDETVDNDDVTERKSSAKRKANQIENDKDEASDRKKKVCMYGSKCYQTNPDHMKNFLHPEELPNVFSGLQVYVPDTIKDFNKLRRYIIAYDGDVVTDKSTATHIIANSKEENNEDAVVLSAEWAWASIKKGRLLPVKKFRL
ncbi:DNA ligase 3 isoform X2 [Nematostella vectensis]|uniref:DNA ligase 3 isoform X2 n=1 Tax=Nematostella vectensis TaxID=45351 RepID=UPI0020773792|nr:DNA ligase 3 isoform X2 [Nematostella vectensis]